MQKEECRRLELDQSARPPHLRLRLTAKLRTMGGP
jgi:hypothetical protein